MWGIRSLRRKRPEFSTQFVHSDQSCLSTQAILWQECRGILLADMFIFAPLDCSPVATSIARLCSYLSSRNALAHPLLQKRFYSYAKTGVLTNYIDWVGKDYCSRKRRKQNRKKAFVDCTCVIVCEGDKGEGEEALGREKFFCSPYN